jgi:hypothetical protein
MEYLQELASGNKRKRVSQESGLPGVLYN